MLITVRNPYKRRGAAHLKNPLTRDQVSSVATVPARQHLISSLRGNSLSIDSNSVMIFQRQSIVTSLLVSAKERRKKRERRNIMSDDLASKHQRGTITNRIIPYVMLMVTARESGINVPTRIPLLVKPPKTMKKAMEIMCKRAGIDYGADSTHTPLAVCSARTYSRNSTPKVRHATRYDADPGHWG